MVRLMKAWNRCCRKGSWIEQEVEDTWQNLGHHKSRFVCHCGWNSVLEAIRAGVPMLVWPLYAENKLNKVCVVEELKVALAVEAEEDDGLVSAEELEKLFTKLINSNEGKLIKERVMALKEEVSVALKEGGPSRVGLANLIESILKN